MASDDIDCLSETHNGDGSPPLPPSPTVALRVIMHGKEAGSIIGKKGDNVKRFREESGAKINISDSSCPERIVTVTGTTDQIFKAFTMICNKFEEDLNNMQNGGMPKPPVTVRLIVPASQCGSLIGKGGTKIKEIREVTGASIQVASEMLPNSTERAVTVSGTAECVTQCTYHICSVMLESPPKGATIPYRPKPAIAPVIFAGGQAYAVPGQYAMPQPDPRVPAVHYAAMPGMPGMPQLTKMALHQGLLQPGMPMMGAPQGLIGMPGGMPGAMMPNYVARLSPPAPAPNAQSHEITIPNDLIGCIIGRGGSKINEIRQFSGAMIKIANVEEGSGDRKVTITGTPETISTAQYLINASLEMHKNLTLDPTSAPTSAPTLTSSPGMTLTSSPAMAMQLPKLMAPGPLMAPSPLMGVGLGGMGGLGGLGPFDGMLGQHRELTTKIRGGLVMQAAAPGLHGGPNKFAPY